MFKWVWFLLSEVNDFPVCKFNCTDVLYVLVSEVQKSISEIESSVLFFFFCACTPQTSTSTSTSHSEFNFYLVCHIREMYVYIWFAVNIVVCELSHWENKSIPFHKWRGNRFFHAWRLCGQRPDDLTVSLSCAEQFSTPESQFATFARGEFCCGGERQMIRDSIKRFSEPFFPETVSDLLMRPIERGLVQTPRKEC